jgi:hypothetical protein
VGKPGPRTERGKAVVRLNAVRHGVLSSSPVIPDVEREEDWEAYRAGLAASLAPVGFLEMAVTERIALLLWRLHRLVRFERDAVVLARERAEEDQEGGETQDLPELKRQQDLIGLRIRLLACLLGLADDAPLGDYEARTILSDAADMTGVDVRSISIPGITDIEQHSGWTVGDVRKGINGMRTRYLNDPPATLFYNLIYAALYDANQLDKATRKAAADTDRLRRERLLPEADTMNRVIRYEAHLHRQLLQTMHELEALQARRQGRQTPLARVDVQGLPTE